MSRFAGKIIGEEGPLKRRRRIMQKMQIRQAGEIVSREFLISWYFIYRPAIKMNRF